MRKDGPDHHDGPHDPVVEEAFDAFIQQTYVPLDFHARVMARVQQRRARRRHWEWLERWRTWRYERLAAVRAWAQPVLPPWQSWGETLADAVVTALASESEHRLGSLERTRFASQSQESDWTADVRSIIQHEVLPFLQTCQPSGPPAATVRSLTSVQRAQLVERIQRRARYLRPSAAEAQRLLEALTSCLLAEPREGEDVQAER